MNDSVCNSIVPLNLLRKTHILYCLVKQALILLLEPFQIVAQLHGCLLSTLQESIVQIFCHSLIPLLRSRNYCKPPLLARFAVSGMYWSRCVVQSARGTQCKENLGTRGQLPQHTFASHTFFVHSKQTSVPRRKQQNLKSTWKRVMCLAAFFLQLSSFKGG